MITKKAFVTTSKIILTATLLSQICSFKNITSHPQTINYSAFINLAQNVESVSSQSMTSAAPSNMNVVTNDIIKVIDKEISKKISKTRYSVGATKTSLKKNSEKNSEETSLSSATYSNELTSYEINNSNLINLYGLPAEEISFKKFESIKLADSYDEEIKDEVIVAQASTAPIGADKKTMTNSENVSENSTKENEEMVMFDYSEKSAPAAVAKTIDQQLYERPISRTVQQAINREMGNTSNNKATLMNTQRYFSEAVEKNTTKIDNQDIDLDSSENDIYDYSIKDSKAPHTKSPTPSEVINGFLAPTPASSELNFILAAKEINLSTQEKRQSLGFEFVPDYERAERQDDQSSGEIAFGYSLVGEMNTQTGVVLAQGMISTRVELNLGSTANLEVPLIHEEGMQKFLQKQGLSIKGNLVMLAIGPSIVDTEIDSRFAERFFFNNNFQLLPSAKDASFVMYAGVKTGNIMIRYLLDNKESAQKVVYVGDGEMYFENAEFTRNSRETFIFTTRNLLGYKKKELIIDGGDISYFNTTITAKKKALNAYEIKVPTLVSGMRKYLEFKHLSDTIFVGSSNEKEIEIPSNDFVSKVLEMNQVQNLKDRCVVQINLAKDVREIKANGKNSSGEMFVETSFLDKDGSFVKDNPEMAEKAFVVGDMEGQFNVKLDYTDGSTQFLKTFCSEGSYLVEQL